MHTTSVRNPAGSNRLTSYYEFQARRAKREEVAHDVIEFEPVEDTGIEVIEGDQTVFNVALAGQFLLGLLIQKR